MLRHDNSTAHYFSRIQDLKSMIKETFVKKNPSYGMRLLQLYGNANGYDDEWYENADWGIFTLQGIDNFCRHLQSTLAQNSAKTYAKMFRAILNIMRDQVAFPQGYEKLLALKGEAVVSTWLTDEEIERLVSYQSENNNEELVRNQFVLGCLTGARWSDYVCMTPQNIVGDNIVYISKKTGIRSEIPLSPAVERILCCADFTDSVSKTTFNRTIRAICKKVGISGKVMVHTGGETQEGEKWKFVSSHTARRSFATNLYLRCRDIFLVSRYMGHSSVDMTAKYILSIGDAPEDVKMYFEQFK